MRKKNIKQTGAPGVAVQRMVGRHGRTRNKTMNYEENKTQWKVGDLVLHDADAKRPEMLMKVIGYAKDGRCKTRYAEPNQMNGDALRIKMRQKPEVWENGIRVLHDPARFGVNVVPPNTKITRDDGQERRVATKKGIE